MTTDAAPRHTNRLARETSPYLLQHAHNPVDWYPWGEEAFEAARQSQRPIFLSIGYSTCYWCHVMERESFEDERVAALMNERFVNVKVDREERPDVDDVYMTAVQLLTGRGGWPMSVFLLPPPADDNGWQGLQPFYAGTYFPPRPGHGLPGFSQLLTAVDEAWRERRDEVVRQAQEVAAAVTRHLTESRGAVAIGRADVETGVELLLRLFDPAEGGFGRAPKFPQPVYLDFLLDARESLDVGLRGRVDQAIRLTLDRMAMGGVYDQVGGGFHRYSTDAKWLVPHFEKMLYDNGQLMLTYARAAEVYRDSFHRRIVAEIGEYVLREMTGREGGFYSAQDAEVRGREGLNYLWTPDAVRQVLSEAGAGDLIEFAVSVYGLDRAPNFQDPHHRDEPPAFVLALVDHPTRLAERADLSEDEFHERLDRVDAILLEARSKRDQPRLDDKVIASWNGLMIAGMARGGAMLGRTEFIDAARRAWEFINSNMRDGDGRLQRIYRAGTTRGPAFAEDYAALAHGLIELHRATGRTEFVDAAAALVREADELFGDRERGGWFDTRADQSDLFVRGRSVTDGAVPSANGLFANVLIDLAEITGDEAWLDKAVTTIGALSGSIHESPAATANSTRALRRLIAIAPQRAARLEDVEAAPGAERTASWLRVEPWPLVVSRGGETDARVVLELPEGMHVNAHEPGDENLVGLTIEVDGGDGVSAAVRYPAAEDFTMGDRAIRVHSGHVEIGVRLRARSSAEGEPTLVVTCQACTERACFAPVRERVAIRIDDGPRDSE